MATTLAVGVEKREAVELPEPEPDGEGVGAAIDAVAAIVGESEPLSLAESLTVGDPDTDAVLTMLAVGVEKREAVASPELETAGEDVGATIEAVITVVGESVPLGEPE